MAQRDLIRLFVTLILGLQFLSCAPPTRDLASTSSPESKVLPELDADISPSLPPQFENVNFTSAIARPVGASVDQQFGKFTELLKTRVGASSETDTCDSRVAPSNTFADRISYSVLQHFMARDPQLFPLASTFNLPDNAAAMSEVSLVSHPQCKVTTDSLKATIGSGKVPGTKTIQRVNAFADQINSLREQYKAGSLDAGISLGRVWSKFFMCLSYVESLTSADTNSSQKVAKKYAPAGFNKPPGVLFYEDPSQSASSRLNIGLYQFTPTASGNIFTCMKQWNRINSSCSLASKSSQAQMIKALGSDQQGFNAFCGVEKLTDSFGVQVNSRSSKRSHPANLLSNGKLKPAAERCVSFVFNGQSYNHFGPFQNSTGSNLAELMSCVAAP